MKFGYMSGFRSDLCSEIEFAKKHFDFTEITIQPELLKTISGVFPNIKKALSGFEVLGHIHWEIIRYDDILKNADILRSLGAKKITIHPFQKLSLEENAKIFNKISDAFQSSKTELLIENVSSQPFSSEKDLSELLKKVPEARLTLDIGHANRNLELDKFIKNLAQKIGHIHLHDNTKNLDHVFYNKKEELKSILSKIRSFGYDGTILFETFSIIKGDKNISQEFPEIKKLHIEQLKKLSNG